jgi:hypothetical protein
LVAFLRGSLGIPARLTEPRAVLAAAPGRGDDHPQAQQEHQGDHDARDERLHQRHVRDVAAERGHGLRRTRAVVRDQHSRRGTTHDNQQQAEDQHASCTSMFGTPVDGSTRHIPTSTPTSAYLTEQRALVSSTPFC